MNDIIITTTPSIEGRQIKKYLGLVASKGWVPTTSMLGDAKKDKNLEHQHNLMKSVENGLRAEAERLNANAVVSVKFQYDKAGVGSTLLAFGTAVLIEKDKMEEKKTLGELREELKQEINSMTSEQQERLLRSWKVTQKLNKIPGHESLLYVFLK